MQRNKNQMEFSVKVKINDTLDQYNSSSDYYNDNNDICHKANSVHGTDITLQDSRNQFINNNMSLCVENCYFFDYNYIIEKENLLM